MIVVSNHHKLLREQNRPDGERFANLTGLIHDAVVELEAKQQIVIHLQTRCSIHVVLVQSLLYLLHRVKHVVGAHVALDGFVRTSDVVRHSNEVVES